MISHFSSKNNEINVISLYASNLFLVCDYLYISALLHLQHLQVEIRLSLVVMIELWRSGIWKICDLLSLQSDLHRQWIGNLMENFSLQCLNCISFFLILQKYASKNFSKSKKIKNSHFLCKCLWNCNYKNTENIESCCLFSTENAILS